ncbi:hypothetical protein ACFX2J_000161 [Malus domestica]
MTGTAPSSPMLNQAKEVDELKKQMGQMAEFMGQFKEQGKLPSTTVVNPRGGFESAKAITLRSGKEVRTNPQPSKYAQMEDEKLQKEEEEDTPTAREEQPLPQVLKASMPCNSGNDVPNSILSNPIPPNVPFPHRFMISKEEENEKDIVEALSKVPSTIPLLVTTKQVPECVEFLEENCTSRRRIQEKEVAKEDVECIKANVCETTKPKEVEFYDRTSHNHHIKSGKVQHS